MPLPADPKVIFLGGIFLILLLAALYITAEIVWPLILAFALSLVLNPLLRFLARLHVPRVLAALMLVAAVLALVVALGTAVSGPAASWAAKLPDGLPRLFQRLTFLEAPFAALQHFWQQIEDFAGWQMAQARRRVALFLQSCLPAAAVSRAALYCALRKPLVHRSQQLARLLHLALVAPEACEAHGGAEFHRHSRAPLSGAGIYRANSTLAEAAKISAKPTMCDAYLFTCNQNGRDDSNYWNTERTEGRGRRRQSSQDLQPRRGAKQTEWRDFSGAADHPQRRQAAGRFC